MPAMITKPNNIFDKGELEQKYRIFQEKTQAIADDIEMKRQRDEALGVGHAGTKADPIDDNSSLTHSRL